MKNQAKNMKIALIGQKGIPSTSGGVEKHVESLAVRLVELGHEVLAYTRPNYTDKNMKEFKGVKLISLPSLATKNLDAISHTFLACLDLIFRRRVDVIHFHSIGPSSLMFLVKLFKPRTPIVFTFHCQDYYHQKWGRMARWYLKLGEKVGCRLADQVLCVSKELTAYTNDLYKNNSVYVPNGINLPEILAPQIIKQWGLETGNYIVAISRLIRHKGLHYLVKAYSQLKTDKKLVIVGEGAYTDDYVNELKALAQNNPNIIFTGKQSGAALGELFSNPYLFVQPSESEGLSIALLEAMSYQNACLASDITANLEVVDGGALTFKSQNVDDLRDKLQYCLEHPEVLAENKERMYARVKSEYNWQNIVNDIVRIYGETVAKK